MFKGTSLNTQSIEKFKHREEFMTGVGKKNCPKFIMEADCLDKHALSSCMKMSLRNNSH